MGEAFNVSRSFFRFKKRDALNRLHHKEAQYKIIIFNKDAVNNSSYYIEKSNKQIAYLPIDIWGQLEEFHRDSKNLKK